MLEVSLFMFSELKIIVGFIYRSKGTFYNVIKVSNKILYVLSEIIEC